MLGRSVRTRFGKIEGIGDEILRQKVGVGVVRCVVGIIGVRRMADSSWVATCLKGAKWCFVDIPRV